MTDEAIILVGGLGTRLRGVVDDVPKPLALVQGRPFLAWLLDQLAEQGLRRVVLAAGYKAEIVRASVGDHWRGMAVDYMIEAQPLGTGGAIANAVASIEGDSAFVLNGDTYVRLAYGEFAASIDGSGCMLGIALAQVADVSRYGAVATADGRVTALSEKGASGAGYINAGVYWLRTRLIRQIGGAGRAFSFEHDVLQPEAAAGRVGAFLGTASFIDIGLPSDYQRAQSWLFSGHEGR